MGKKDYNRPARIARAVLAAIIILVLGLQWRRTVTYRKVVYDYQALTESRSQSEREGLLLDIERKVGRANTPWYHLDKAPRYLHFWDEYNIYTNIQLENITYGMDE